jgi:HSP20 family molecular chaperone IbpA
MRAPQRGISHWHGTVKVQRSITPPGQVLIYNERRSLMYQQAMPRALERMFFPDELKFYADATFRNGVLKINARREPEAW